MERRQSNLDVALHYHSLGFNVIPAQVRGKAPALETWREYQTRMSTEAEIRSWWKANPRYNIGAITGKISGIVVVDVDDPNKAMPTLMPYRTYKIATSGKGTGYHLYYKYPSYATTVPNRVKFLQGADIRADGGFIILPPSVHPTGKIYMWSVEGDMIELPRPLYNMIVERSANPDAPLPNEMGWVTSLLLNGSQSGSRDDDATRLAGYFTSQKLPPDIILGILRGWYERTDQNGFSWSQVEKCVASVYAKESSQPSNQPPPIQSLTTPMLQFLGSIDTIKWLIEDWMPKSSTSLMVAPPGTYKTWIMISMCLSIATGLPFLGRYKARHGNVLMIQVEDGKSILRQRIRTIYSNMLVGHYTPNFKQITDGEWELTMPPDPNLDIWTADYLLAFANPEDMDLLEKMIVERKYDFVIFDPLYAFADADDYMTAAAQKMMRLKSIRDRTGCTFLVLHHTKKTNANDDDNSIDRQDAWGSQFLNAWLEFGFQVRANKKDKELGSVRLLRHGKMTKPYAPIRLKMNINTALSEIDEAEFSVEIEDITAVDTSGITLDRQDGKVDMNLDEAAVMQLAISLGGIIRNKDIVDGLGFPKSTATKRLQTLVDKGMLTKQDDGSCRIVSAE